MLTIQTDKTRYTVNERLLITLTLYNDTDRPQEITFPSAQRFEIVAERDGQPFWSWSGGRLFARVQTALVIEPGDSRVFRAEWQQTDSGGRRVPRGIYTVRARLVNGAEWAETTVELTDTGGKNGRVYVSALASFEYSDNRKLASGSESVG